MNDWSGWEVGRVVLALSAVAYLGIWIQVSLFHRAGAFSHKAMYGPVVLTPLIVGGILAGVVTRAGVWGWVAAALLVLGVLEGLIGVYYHLKGIVSQVGGLTVRNMMAGPPPVLPVAYSLMGVFGLVGLLMTSTRSISYFGTYLP